MADALPTRWPQVTKTTAETTRVAFTVFDFYRMIQLYMPRVLEGVELDKATGLPPIGQASLHLIEHGRVRTVNNEAIVVGGTLVDSLIELVLTVTRKADA